MKRLALALSSLFFVFSAYAADDFDIEGVLGIKKAVETKEELPVASLGVDLDENFPPKNANVKKPESQADDTKVTTSDSSIGARLETLEQNQGVIITKLNSIARAVERPQLSKKDVDVVVRKAITDLIMPHLTIRTKDGINKTVAASNTGGFNLKEGEFITSIDGVPVSNPTVVGSYKNKAPIYETTSGSWRARYTTGNNGFFGGVRQVQGRVCINGSCN